MVVLLFSVFCRGRYEPQEMYMKDPMWKAKTYIIYKIHDSQHFYNCQMKKYSIHPSQSYTPILICLCSASLYWLSKMPVFWCSVCAFITEADSSSLLILKSSCSHYPFSKQHIIDLCSTHCHRDQLWGDKKVNFFTKCTLKLTPVDVPRMI